MQKTNVDTKNLQPNLLRLLAVVSSSLLLCTLLTPIVMTALQLLFEDFSYPFSRVFDRVALVAVVVSIWIFFSQVRRESSVQNWQTDETKGERIGSLSKGLFGRLLSKSLNVANHLRGLATAKADIFTLLSNGVRKNLSDKSRLSAIKNAIISYTIILLLGVVSTCLISIINIQDGALYLRGISATYFWQKLALIVPGALITALIEELIFRRFLLGSLLAMGLRAGVSVMIVSMIFALVHFIFPMKSFEYREFNPWAGLDYLSLVFGRFSDPQLYLGVTGMFLIGCCLGGLFVIRRSIIPSVILHAGLIIGIKTIFFSTRMIPELEFDQVVTRRYILIANPTSWSIILGLGIMSMLIYLINIKRSGGGQLLESE